MKGIMITITATRIVFAAGVFVGAAFGIAAGPLIAPADASPTVQEDDPGWSCVDSANHVCGPLSDDWGHAPGCYDDGGVMVAAWPCSVVVNPDGSSDVYTPDARG